MALSREALFHRLDQRLADSTIGEAQDRAIWDECGATRAVLVIDLAGFTRITRARGILHFLTVYRRATALAVPCFEAHGGRCVKREADNLIASFPDVRRAIDSAREIVSRSLVLDATLAEDDRVRPCIGIGYGKILELEDDLFGDEVNVAFKLGEDVACAREILVTDAAHEAVGDLACDERAISLGGLDVRYWILK